MTRAFISYAQSDQAFATRLAAALPTYGVDPWIDHEDARRGTRWSASVQQVLDSCDVLVLVLTPAAMASSIVEEQWQYALDQGKPVLPALLEPTELHFQLGRIQYVDFHESAFETALPQLAAGLERAVAARRAAEESTDPARGGEDGANVTRPGVTATAAGGPTTGTVTFLFVELVGSAEGSQRPHEAEDSVLERCEALLREAVAGSGGLVYKRSGDAFRMVFLRAGDALAAAVAAQRAVAAELGCAVGDGLPSPALRAALHTGEAIERAGDYFGPAVNRAARLEAAGHGGQILLSQGTQLVVREGLPKGYRLRDWGEHRLRDLRFSEHIFQIEGPGLPETDTPPVTAEALHPRERVRVAAPSPPEGNLERASAAALSAPAADSLWARLAAAVTAESHEAVTLTPEEARELARHKPGDLRQWRLGRIAEWSQPRYRLDGRFVGLTLLIDQGEEADQGRWQAKEQRFDDLSALLESESNPAVVVLGPPGSGKSTLLRRLELDSAIDGLRAATKAGEGTAAEKSDDHGDAARRVTLYVPLNTYRAQDPGEPAPAPAAWLAELWADRAPDLPPLAELLAEGRLLLLLDGLNEMPASSEAEFHGHVKRWKRWLQRLVADDPGNRVVLSCRSLDYSQPLSAPELRVPQVQIEALSNPQVRDFLMLYSPARWREIWAALEDRPQLEVLRSPYFLSLLVEQVEATGSMPSGRASLFTGFVRQALRREVERGSAVFEAGELLAGRDLRQIVRWRWKDDYDLPQRGVLLPKLASLAHAMQAARADGERSQVRVDIEEALDLLDSEADEQIVNAGAALAVLDEDEAAGELMYIHQLVQEYFAARELAAEPDPELVSAPWRAAEISPNVEEVLDGLDPADPLPGNPQTGWEETTLLAAAMSADRPAFLRQLMPANLTLAGRAAAQPELRDALPDDLLRELRGALAVRSRDTEADLRVRMDCARALGDLGDPRFERHGEAGADYLLPPWVEIRGGSYPIGGDEPITWAVAGLSGTNEAHIPRHEVEVAGFAIGRFPVTNAEWACFMAAGGYEEERWWPTEDARRWRRGELANAGAKINNRMWRRELLAQPDLLEKMVKEGSFPGEEVAERWRAWMALDEAGFEAALDMHWQPKRATQPSQWQDPRFNHPSQPIVGVSWYEAMAYCTWLSARSGRTLRLPTEVEWEAAAGGFEGRTYPWGEDGGRARANTSAMRMRRTSPVGVFVDGDSPLGVADLGGNVYEWTTSLYGEVDETVEDAEIFTYPYQAADGRESHEAASSIQRVVRGGGWISVRADAGSKVRGRTTPSARDYFNGFRLVREE